MSYQDLLVEISEGIALLTINRPQSLNAMTRETMGELGDAVRSLIANSAVRVVILTGAGNKAFVAGGNIAMMVDFDPNTARAFALEAQAVCTAIEQSPKPFIAALNGFALGGGCELAMCCDIRIASENAKLGQPEINIGTLPGFGGSQRLPRLVGKGRALEMIMTGEMIDAQEAWRIGLVNRVVPQAELLEVARELARKLAAKSMVVLSFCKEAIYNGMEMDLPNACRYEVDLFALSFATADRREGMQAFVEKRKPVFTDC